MWLFKGVVLFLLFLSFLTNPTTNDIIGLVLFVTAIVAIDSLFEDNKIEVKVVVDYGMIREIIRQEIEEALNKAQAKK